MNTEKLKQDLISLRESVESDLDNAITNETASCYLEKIDAIDVILEML